MKITQSSNTRLGSPLYRVRACRGFSMMEVLVTVLILAIGLLGLAGLQGVSVRNNHSAYLRTQATHLAYEIVDAMRANRVVAQAGGYDLAYSTAPATAGVAQADLTGWRQRVSTNLPVGDSRIQRVGNSFTISVRWDDSRGAAGFQEFNVATQL